MTSKLPDAEALLPRLAAQLKAEVTPATAMIGMHTGGVWVAERLHPLLGLKDPLGLMDISFYRDDFAKAAACKHDPKPSRIPFDVEGATSLLVDDVLYTGRTVRAAMNELFDYGRPASIALVVLVDRGGREAADRRAARGRAASRCPRASACGCKRADERRASSLELEETQVANNPQLNASGRAAAPAHDRRPAARDPDANPRYCRILRRRGRARGEEGAAAARQERLQPVLRALDAHPHHLRDRRQAPVCRRDQPQHRHLSPDQGRDRCSTPSTTLRRCTPTCSSCAMPVGRAASHRAPRGAAHHVINAGDGRHAHPTQGLLDMFTIRHYKKEFSQPDRGDRRRRAAFARGALADPRAHHAGRAGSARDRAQDAAADRRRAAGRAGVSRHGARACKDCDVVIMLRLQNERMSGALLPSAQEYFKFFGLTPEKLALAKPDAIVMHPGPMNRGVEIDSAVADGPQSVILPQVTFGIAVRMAVMAMLAGTGRGDMKIHIKNGRVIDPMSATRCSQRTCLWLRANRRHRRCA